MFSKIKSAAKNIKNNILSNYIKLICFVLIILFLLSVIGLFILNTFFTLTKDTFSREIGNTLLQIIAVGIFGTIFTLLLEQYKRIQENIQIDKENQRIRNEADREIERISNENKNQFRKDILHQLNEVYNGIKNARRMLRAKAFNAPYIDIDNTNSHIKLDQYDHYMENINELQLKLELIKKEITTNKSVFSKSEEICNHMLFPIEDSLNKIIDEYIENRPKFDPNQNILPIKDGRFEKLNDMLKSAKLNGEFKRRFFDKYGELVSEIQKELVSKI
jgi:hypothetical protein